MIIITLEKAFSQAKEIGVEPGPGPIPINNSFQKKNYTMDGYKIIMEEEDKLLIEGKTQIDSSVAFTQYEVLDDKFKFGFLNEGNYTIENVTEIRGNFFIFDYVECLVDSGFLINGEVMYQDGLCPVGVREENIDTYLNYTFDEKTRIVTVFFLDGHDPTVETDFESGVYDGWNVYNGTETSSCTVTNESMYNSEVWDTTGSDVFGVTTIDDDYKANCTGSYCLALGFNVDSRENCYGWMTVNKSIEVNWTANITVTATVLNSHSHASYTAGVYFRNLSSGNMDVIQLSAYNKFKRNESGIWEFKYQDVRAGNVTFEWLFYSNISVNQYFTTWGLLDNISIGITQSNLYAPEPPELLYPVNNTQINDSFTFDLNYSVVDNDLHDINCSLFINGVLNKTNNSISNGSVVVNSITFQAGNYSYNWSVNCTDVEAVNTSGISYFSTVDKIPNLVTGTSFTASESVITIQWSANPEDDISFYHVYMTNAVDGDYTEVNTTTGLTYSESGLIAGERRYYKVSAEDNQGNEGPNSTIINARTVGGEGEASSDIVGVGSSDSYEISSSACDIYIKKPKGRVYLLQSSSPEDFHDDVEFIVCNNNNVPVLHRFSFEQNLSTYCELDKTTMTINGEECVSNFFSCSTPEDYMSGRLYIKRDAYSDENQVIPQCETNILIKVGEFSLVEVGKEIFGRLFWPVVVAVPFIIIIFIIGLIKIFR